MIREVNHVACFFICHNKVNGDMTTKAPIGTSHVLKYNTIKINTSFVFRKALNNIQM